MNQIPVQTQTPAQFRFVFFVPLILILGFLLGFYTNNLYFKKIQNAEKLTPPSAQPKIDESKLPISLSLLQNPIVYEWRGDVGGRITAKDQHTFTIEDDQGNKITITDKTPTGSTFNTRFFKKVAKAWQEASLSAIPIRSTLRGEFFIFKGSNNTPVGSAFEIVQ